MNGATHKQLMETVFLERIVAAALDLCLSVSVTDRDTGETTVRAGYEFGQICEALSGLQHPSLTFLGIVYAEEGPKVRSAGWLDIKRGGGDHLITGSSENMAVDVLVRGALDSLTNPDGD